MSRTSRTPLFLYFSQLNPAPLLNLLIKFKIRLTCGHEFGLTTSVDPLFKKIGSHPRIVCWTCKGLGHYSRDCERNKCKSLTRTIKLQIDPLRVNHFKHKCVNSQDVAVGA